MESFNTITSKMYYNIRGKRDERINEIRHYINELTRWGITEKNQGGLIVWKPDDKNINDFQIRLYHDSNDNLWEVKFGDLNKPNREEQFYWDKDDKNKLKKSLFLIDVLENKILSLLSNKKIEGIKFNPYDGDNLGEERKSYFENMFSKLNKNQFKWIVTKDYEDEDIYIIKNK